MKLGATIVGLGPISQGIEWAKTIEDYGFDSLGYSDDMMFKPGWPMVYVLSQHTSRIELGVTVSNPQTTHPAILASNAAMLDEMSNGRAFMGIGRGHLQVLEATLNVVPQKPLQAVREAIELSKRLWRKDATPYRGEVFSGSEMAQLHWDPVRDNIPVLMGTWSPKATTMAGALAERVMPVGCWNLAYANRLQQCIVDGASEVGRDPNECELELEPFFSIKEDEVEARAAAMQDLVQVIHHLSPMMEAAIDDKELLGRIIEAGEQQDHEKTKSLLTDEIVSKFALYGTPHQIIDKIEHMSGETGIKRISFNLEYDPAQVEERIHLLGKKVVPHFLAGR